MKHIFFVHSNISLLSSLAIVQRKNLNYEDVFFLTKNFKLSNLNYNFSSIDSTYNNKSFNNLFTNYPRKVDKFISEKFPNQKFVCYFEMMSYEERVFATNKNCHSFNFIEEGTAALSGSQTLEHFTVIFRHLNFRVKSIFSVNFFFDFIIKLLKGYNIRLISIPFQPSNYYAHKDTIFYGFSKYSFNGVSDDKCYVLSFEDCLPFFSLDIPKFENVIFYIEDNFSRSYGHIDNEEDVIIECLSELMIENYVEKIVYLPRKQNEIRSLDSNVFQKLRVKPEVLERSIPFELVLFNSKNSKVFGGTSALLYYSSLFGLDVHSYFFKLNNRPWTVYENMSVFWDKINL